jgi:hypothetical protein
MPITDLVGGHTLGNTNVTIDTSRFVFGTASARFTAANGSRLTIPSDSDTSLNIWCQGNAPAPNSMTYEFWFFPSSTSQSCNLFSTLAPDSSGVTSDPTSSLNLTLSGLTVTMTSFAKSAFSQTVSGTAINGWNHVAIVVPPTSGVVFYLNGTQVGGLAFSTYRFFPQPTFVGSNFGGTGSYFDGWIDDLRYTPSQRYSGNFTPGYAPAAPQWVTGDTLTLATGTEGQTVNATIVANAVDPQANGIFQYGVKTVSYSLDHFSITNTGLVTATLPPSNSPFVFTVDAIDTNGNHSKTHTYTLQSSVTTIPELKYSWRFEAANTSTFIVPNVGSGTPSLANGTATYTAAPAPYSANNAIHLQSNAQITMPTSTNFEFLANTNWTVEFWADINSAPSANNSTLISVGPLTGNTGNEFRVFNNANGVYSFVSASTFGTSVAGVDFAAPAVGWNHFAVVRNANTISTFMNGTLCNSLSNAATLGSTLYDSGQLTINGLTGSANGNSFSDLYLRGLNFFNISKYTENFTPVFNDYFQPIWKTNPGVVVSAWEGNAISANVSVLAEAFGANNTLSYSVATGSMPSGISLAANGTITGTVPTFSHTSNSPAFTLIATDTSNIATPVRSFIVNSISTAPMFTNTNIGFGISNTAIPNLALTTFDPHGLSVTYDLQNGSTLPPNLSLSNGVISGSLTKVLSDTPYTFVINAVNSAGRYNPTTLSYTNYTAADPLFNQVATLVHAEDTPNSTVLADATGKLTYNLGNASVSTANKKFGSSSLFFSGATSAVNIAQSQVNPSSVSLGTNAFTMEAWVYPTSLNFSSVAAYRGSILALKNPTSGATVNDLAFSFYILGTSTTVATQLVFEAYATGGAILVVCDAPASITMNAWSHVAVVRNGANISFFLNGVLLTTTYSNVLAAGSSIPLPTGGTLHIGGLSYPGITENFGGYMDEIRITNGAARYTANFAVPTMPFPSIRDDTPIWNVANTKLVFDSGMTVSSQLTTSVPTGATVSYSVVSGSLPSGLMLNSNGLVTGTTGNVLLGQNAVVSNATIMAQANTGSIFQTSEPVSYVIQANDFYYANVSTLIHAEDTPNSTVLADATGKLTYTLNSGGSVSTANKMFGNSSLYFTGATSATNIIQSQANPSSVNFGTNAFTLEAWVYPVSLTNNRAAIMALKNPSSGPTITDLAFFWYLSGSASQATSMVLEFDTQAITVSATAPFTMNTWSHIAVIRSGATVLFFLNGTKLTTINTAPPTSGTSVPLPAGSTLQIGGLTYSGTSSNFGGYMDELRITNGTARYTANFTVAALPFPSSQDATPIWVSNGTIGGGQQLSNVAVQLSATSPNTTITYSLASGSLPVGMTLNSNGLISGTMPAATSDTPYVFTANATAKGITTTSNTLTIVDYFTPSDTFYANTVALLHFDSLSNSVVDGSFVKNTYTTTVNGYTSNVQVKFGNAALALTGANTTVAPVTSQANPNGFNLGSNNFTIEAWVYPKGLLQCANGTWRGMIMNLKSLSNTLSLTDDVFTFWLTGTSATAITGITIDGYEVNGTTANVNLTGTVSVPVNQWNHIAFVRNGSTSTFFLNGTSVTATGTNITTAFAFPAGVQFNVGGLPYVGFSANLNGYIDDVRVTNGIARYSGNFSPPTGPFPDHW